MPPQQSNTDRPTRTEQPQGQPRPQRRPAPRKPFVLQRVRRQDLILLTGVLALACFSVITVGLLILRYQQSRAGPAGAPGGMPGPRPTHTVTYVQVTGLSRYELAEAEARAWAADAQLVSANAHWPRVIYADQVGEPGAWTYRFYALSKERLFMVKVAADGQVRAFEHVALITLPPDVLDATEWRIDSPAALARWLDHGGAELVRRNPGLEVLIQLRSLSRHPEPVWMVTGSDKRTQDIHVVVIDASSGQVVPTNPTR